MTEALFQYISLLLTAGLQAWTANELRRIRADNLAK